MDMYVTLFVLLWQGVETGVYMVAFCLMLEGSQTCYTVITDI